MAEQHLRVDSILEHGAVDELIERFTQERAGHLKAAAKLKAQIARLKATRITK